MEAIPINRYFIWLSYEGTNYRGWQIQPGMHTLQQTLNDAMSILLRENVDTIGAGRTDAGVHASTFAAHFDTSLKLKEREILRLIYRLNRILPSAIAVQKIEAVHPEIHARYSALSRTYYYFINSRKDPFLTGRSWRFERKLNIGAMQKAADLLLEYEDFTSFSKTNTQVSTFICRIDRVQWHEENGVLRFEITADRFLRNMVRAIVGTLVEVGLGKITPNDFANIIEIKDRRKAGYSAPACGLFLKDIQYPKGYQLV